jgi:thiamine pyrophosphate-dependent acetolactate synthase large subunit-like protein
VTADEIGLHFFTADEKGNQPASASVFGPVDQEEIIARIDDVEDDDLDSPFFADSMKEVEDAATRSFDVGIRTLTDDPAGGRAAFGSSAGIGSHVAEPGAHAPISAEQLKQDDRARRDFILGGPTGSSG